ncbi:MAG TPA: thiamine pyrophosphate-binding protein [Kofleriaceae bacterium]|nr:thiamine pyrophosphate-binding protein [Kofleriaceae bacterium]
MTLESDQAMSTVTRPVAERSRPAASAELAHGDALVAAIVEAGFRFVTGVPDSALAGMCSALDRQHRGQLFLPGTREDNCVALAAGAQLAGTTPMVFMKSAGLGTCVDALTSLVEVYRIPLVLLISWAGYAGRDVPHHNVIGEVLEPVLEALRIPARPARLGDPADVARALRAAREAAERDRTVVAVLGIPADLLEAADPA